VASEDRDFLVLDSRVVIAAIAQIGLDFVRVSFYEPAKNGASSSRFKRARISSRAIGVPVNATSDGDPGDYNLSLHHKPDANGSQAAGSDSEISTRAKRRGRKHTSHAATDGRSPQSTRRPQRF
jgi:hypothetical protein